VGEKIREIFDAQVIDIVMYDHKTNLIEDRYAYEKGDRTLLGPREVTGFRKHIIRTKQILLHNENVERAMREFDNKILIGDMPKSQIYVPLIAASEVSGIISLQNLDHEHAFSESDVNLLTTLANSMSVALESARLFDETARLLKETEQRTAELSVINSVQDGLAKELDIQGIYNLVGEKIREIFNAQVIDIVTYDKIHQSIEDRYTYEKGDRSLLGPRPLKGFRKYVIETHKPLLINRNLKAQRAKYDQSVITGEGAKSIVLVPMIVGGEVTGVISLQNLDQENAFNESEVNLLSMLSSSMSVALENARLFDETNRLLKETEQRTAELAVINSVQEGLAKELDMRGIYKLVGDRLCTMFPDSQTLVIRTFNHESNQEYFEYFIEKGADMQVDPRPFMWANKQLIHSKKSLLINENYVETAKKFGGTGVTKGQPPKSAVFVPMIVGDIVKGSISLQNVDEEFGYSDSDLRLLTTLTNSMSVALENARLFDETNRLLKETEQQKGELAIINSVQEGLASKLDIQSIYDLVGDKIRDVFDADGITISHYDEPTNFISLPYNMFKGQRIIEEGFYYGKGLMSHVISTGETLLINENAVERFKELGTVYAAGETDENTAKSWLGVPLSSGDKVKGVIKLENYEKEHAYTASDVSLLQTLANSISVALENARLFDETNRLLKETEQRTAELAVINSVQEGLVREMDMQGIYDVVGDRLYEIFNTTNLVIRTFDHETGTEIWRYSIEKGQREYSEPRPFIWANKQLIQTKKPIHITKNYVETAKKFGGTGVSVGNPPKSAIFVPMIVGDVVKGSVSLQNVDIENAFSESDLRLLTTLTNSMSVALENARLFDETTRLLKETEQRTAELAVINSVQEGLA
ncbi:MAG: GAF domain-containing protein, partial [Ferruginibacter sp.]